MVAVRSATSQPLDATGAPTLGSSFIILGLIQSTRWKAYALEPRVVVEVPDLDPMRFKARSRRAGAWLLRVRRAIAAGTDGAALADRIEPRLFWQRGQLAVARGAFERGDVRGALQRIRRVRDHRLIAERQILLGEIRLALRDHEDVRDAASRRQCLDAVSSPAWTELAPQPTATCHHHLLMAVVWTRLGLRRGDMEALCVAAGHLDEAHLDAPARQVLLGMLARARVEVVDALVALRTCARGGFADAVLAEYIRTTQFVTPPALALGRSGLTAPSGDVERALYDEGVALSARLVQRRRVLISASQAWLRRTDDPAVIAPRPRTLVHAGGARAIEAVKSARPSPYADEALCLVAPADGARRAIGKADDRLLRIAELRGGVPRGFAHAYRRAFVRLEREGYDAVRWLAALFHELGLPAPHVLSNIASRPQLPSTPRALFEEVRQRMHVLANDTHDRVAPKLDEAAIDALLLANPARVDPRMRVWSRPEWTTLFSKLARRPFVEHNTLARAADLLGIPYAKLRLGELPISRVTSAGEIRLRLLDKRFDLLTYLRFADVPARSCFRSDCGMYRTQTQDALLDVWQDPLAFCFHVELDGAPCGFVFGSFALADQRACAVLSSLHVHPQRVRLRAIQALETALAPLKIDIGLANLFGGHGPMPDHFHQRVRRVHRLRALGRGDALVTVAYDDVAFTANVTEETDHLWWRG